MGRLGVTGEAIFSYLIPRPALPHNHSPQIFISMHHVFCQTFCHTPHSRTFFFPLSIFRPPLCSPYFSFFLVFQEISSSFLLSRPANLSLACWGLLPAPLWSITAPFHALPREGEGRDQSGRFFYILCISTSESVTLTKMRC